MTSATMTHQPPEHASAPPATCRFGMVIFLISEAMLFAGLIAAYIVLRGATPGDWPPPGAPDIGLEIPPSFLNWVMIVNSVILISSSFAFHGAEVAVQKGKRGLPWLVLTLVLGTVFLSVQGWEWLHLRHEGMWFPTASHGEHVFSLFGIYGTTFFVVTGFHGLHVFVGLLLILWCTLKQFCFGSFTKERHSALANVGLYWHFVDVVWIVVYTSLYVI